MQERDQWDWEIGPKTSNWQWNLGWLFGYRHLLRSLVRREFLLNYQQTLLGPLWILFQPLLTLVTYLLVFGKLIGLGTGSNTPPVLFYFSGIILWTFFSESFLGSTNTFRDHIHVFTKVYFPRIIMPMSLVSTQAIRLGIQLLLLVVMMVYLGARGDFHPVLGWNLLLIPVAILAVAMIAFGAGLVFAILTAKYRDLVNLVNIGVRLLLFVTPVIYPLSLIGEQYAWILALNPLTPWFEVFRLGLLGEGTVHASHLVYSAVGTVILFVLSVHLFNRMGNRLIDLV